MQFEQLTENMEVMIATSDQSGNANYFNKAWEIFTGLSRFELRDYGWADLIHEEDKAGFLKMHADARAVRRNWKGEFRMRNFCGEYRWLLATGIKLETNGVFAGYVSSSVDITEQIAARRIIENSA